MMESKLCRYELLSSVTFVRSWSRWRRGLLSLLLYEANNNNAKNDQSNGFDGIKCCCCGYAIQIPSAFFLRKSNLPFRSQRDMTWRWEAIFRICPCGVVMWLDMRVMPRTSNACRIFEAITSNVIEMPASGVYDASYSSLGDVKQIQATQHDVAHSSSNVQDSKYDMPRLSSIAATQEVIHAFINWVQ